MQLTVIAVGHKMPGWIQTGVDEYTRRLPAEWRFVLKEVRAIERGSGGNGRNAIEAMAREREKIEAAFPKESWLVALDERGNDVSTQQLASLIATWQREARNVVFIIGGADGLDPALKERAALRLRLSSLTLPHGLVRIFLAEQLYRAFSILQNHPYHRV